MSQRILKSSFIIINELFRTRDPQATFAKHQLFYENYILKLLYDDVKLIFLLYGQFSKKAIFCVSLNFTRKRDKNRKAILINEQLFLV